MLRVIVFLKYKKWKKLIYIHLKLVLWCIAACSRCVKCFFVSSRSIRCTVSDIVDIADIVFLKTWYQVEIPKFYNPVTNLLMAADNRAEWKGMKTLGMLRKERAVKAPYTEDSQYQKVLWLLLEY